MIIYGILFLTKFYLFPQGAHEKVLELLETKTEKKLINSSIDNLRQLINHYVEAGDVENLNNLINKIQETRYSTLIWPFSCSPKMNKLSCLLES